MTRIPSHRVSIPMQQFAAFRREKTATYDDVMDAAQRGMTMERMVEELGCSSAHVRRGMNHLLRVGAIVLDEKVGTNWDACVYCERVAYAWGRLKQKSLRKNSHRNPMIQSIASMSGVAIKTVYAICKSLNLPYNDTYVPRTAAQRLKEAYEAGDQPPRINDLAHRAHVSRQTTIRWLMYEDYAHAPDGPPLRPTYGRRRIPGPPKTHAERQAADRATVARIIRIQQERGKTIAGISALTGLSPDDIIRRLKRADRC